MGVVGYGEAPLGGEVSMQGLHAAARFAVPTMVDQYQVGALEYCPAEKGLALVLVEVTGRLHWAHRMP